MPDAPAALVQVAAFQVTSLAAHVVAPPTPGAVNEAASAWSETFSCLVAVDNTMFETVTLAGEELLALVTSPTVNVTPAGNVTRGGKENRAYLANNLVVQSDVSPDRMNLLLDPQTSGGLAICVASDALPRLLSELEARNVAVRAVIGSVLATDTPLINVR